jgi:hypothetical protein
VSNKQKNYNNGFNENFEDQANNDKKSQKYNNKNPLGPLRNYMINFTKISEEINEMPIDRINKLMA